MIDIAEEARLVEALRRGDEEVVQEAWVGVLQGLMTTFMLRGRKSVQLE